MKNIKIIRTGSYLPKEKVTDKELEEKLNLEKGYIKKRTGIETRYYVKDETIEEMAKEAVLDLIKKEDIKDIDLIITATTTTNNLMPGISNYIQEKLEIENAITLDILAGCSGYINALDIARLYISGGIAKKALVVGVDILSKFIDKEDIGTAVVLSDGAGAILLEESDEEKMYFSQIDGNIDKNKILTCKSNEKIQMKGKEVYKYAVTKTVENINKLLEKANLSLDDIKYIVPHQSNLKIINGITSRLKIDENKIYKNIKDVGNTFCGSLPIAINQMKKENLLKNKDKIILLRLWRRSKYRKYFIRNII